MESALREVSLGDRDETGFVDPPIDAVDGSLRTAFSAGREALTRP